MTAPMTLEDYPVAEHGKLLVYGPNSSGKTIFAHSSQWMKTFCFDVDGGMMSAKSWPTVNKKNVHVWRVDSYEEFKNAYTWLKPRISHYNLVTLDTASELLGMVLSEIYDKAGKDIPNQQLWGQLYMMMETIGFMFRQLPCHTLWLAHENDIMDEETKRMVRGPFFRGQFGKNHGKAFDQILRYTLFEKQSKDANNVIQTTTLRFLNCHRDAFITARDRSNSLLKWEEPNIDAIIAKISEAVKRPAA